MNAERPNSPPDICLGLFAKYWEPGKVKTRLAASLGDELAASVYHIFLETLLWRFGSATTSENPRNEGVIVYSPENRDSEFREASSAASEPAFWKLQPQGEGDLGDRLHRFFATHFSTAGSTIGAQASSKVIVIGTDSPTLPLSYLHQADWLLNGHDVVLGPTADGGYYLVAAKNDVPPIFTEIAWSTEKVWSQTIARLQDHHLSFAVLPTWYDVDTIEDLHRLRSEITTTIQQAADTSAPSTPNSLDRLAVANRLSERLKTILDD